MGSPISPGDAIAIISKALESWQKIQDAPEHVKVVGERMKTLKAYLTVLKVLLTDKRESYLAKDEPVLVTTLRDTVKSVEADIRKVADILKRFHNDIGPFGLELRYTSVAHAFFALGSSTDKLNKLSESIEFHQRSLSHSITLLSIVWQKTPAVLDQQRSLPITVGKTDYRVILIDPYHVGRSRVAAAYLELLRESTISVAGLWRIKTIHSSGMLVKRNSDCIELLQEVRAARASSFREGGDAVDKIALDSLFDNKFYADRPFKANIARQAISDGRTSHGMKKRYFKDYDIILTFTNWQTEKLMRLKALVEEKEGRIAGENSRGMVLNLGAYLRGKGENVDIVKTNKCADVKEYRGRWNKTTSQIKSAIKTFLKKEMDWQAPKSI